MEIGSYFDKIKFNGDKVTEQELSRNIQLGYNLEFLISSVLTHLKISHYHSDFSSYASSRGIDVQVPEIGAYIEIKNLSGGYKTTNEWVINKVLKRYPVDAKYRILIVTSKKSFTKYQLKILRQNKVEIIEIGPQVNTLNVDPNQLRYITEKLRYYFSNKICVVLFSNINSVFDNSSICSILYDKDSICIAKFRLLNYMKYSTNNINTLKYNINNITPIMAEFDSSLKSNIPQKSQRSTSIKSANYIRPLDPRIEYTCFFSEGTGVLHI